MGIFFESVAPCRHTRPFWGEEHDCALEHLCLRRLSSMKRRDQIWEQTSKWQTAFVKWEQVKPNKPSDNTTRDARHCFFFFFFFLSCCCVYIQDIAKLSAIRGKFRRCQTCCSHPHFVFMQNVNSHRYPVLWECTWQHNHTGAEVCFPPKHGISERCKQMLDQP